MKFFIIVIFSTILLARPIVPVIEYFINYDYIKNVLCINKDNPENDCNGKCHLQKQLSDVAKENNEKSPLKTTTTEEVSILFSQEISPFNFTAMANVSSDKKYANYKHHYLFQFSMVAFHPPCFTNLI